MTEVEKQQAKKPLTPIIVPLNFLEARKKAKKKAHMTKWFYAAPLGQPRRVDVSNLRSLAETPWARVCIDTIINEICSLDWNVSPKERIVKELKELKQGTGEQEPKLEAWRQKNDELNEQTETVKRFLEHPNDNDESFNHILRAWLKDILELDAGVIVKEYAEEDYVQVKKDAKKGWDWGKWDKVNFSGKRDDHYIKKEGTESVGREFQVRSLNPDYKKRAIIRKLQKKVMEGIKKLNPEELEKLNPPAWSSVGQEMIDPETEKKPQLIAIKAYDGGTFLPDVDRYGYIKGWWQYTYANPGGKPIYFSEKEVVYVKSHPRTIDPYGYSPIQALEEVLEMLDAALDWNKTRFENENTVPGLLVPEESLDEDTFEQVRLLLNPGQQHEKFRHMLTNIKLGFVALTAGGQGKQMDWIEGIQYYFKMIMSEFRVTPSELGFTEGINRATAEEQSEIMRRKSIKPLIELIEHALNTEIIPDLLGVETEELEVEFRFGEGVDRYEQERQVKMAQELFGGQRKMISLNEARTKYLGLDPIDDPRADEVLGPEPQPFGGFGGAGGGFGQLPPMQPVGGREEREEGKEEKPTLPPPKALAQEGKKKYAIIEPEIETEKVWGEEAKRKAEKRRELKRRIEELERRQKRMAISMIGAEAEYKRREWEELKREIERLERELRSLSRKELEVEIGKALTTTSPIIPRAGENIEPLVLEPVTVGVDHFYKLPNPSSSPSDPRVIDLESFEERFQKALSVLFNKQLKEILSIFQKEADQAITLEKAQKETVKDKLKTSIILAFERRWGAGEVEIPALRRTVMHEPQYATTPNTKFYEALEELVKEGRLKFRFVKDPYTVSDPAAGITKPQGLAYYVTRMPEKKLEHEQLQETFQKVSQEHKEEFKDILKRFLEEGLAIGGNKAFEELKVKADFSLDDPLALEYLESFTEFLGNQKYDAVRDRLKAQIREGLLKGESVDVIAKRVREEYSALRGYEAERIARTEVIRSSNMGREAGYVKSGLVKNKQWIVTYDDRTCPYCYEMANQEVGLKQNFFSAEHGHVKSPPLHPNCRCTIVPVLREEVFLMEGVYHKKTSKMMKVEKTLGEPLEIYIPRTYLEEEKSTTQLAEALGVTQMCVVNWLKILKIQAREKGFNFKEYIDNYPPKNR